MVLHEDGVGKQLTSDGPSGNDQRATGVDRLIGGPHHRTGLCGQTHDHIGVGHRSLVVGRVEKADEADIRRGTRTNVIGASGLVAGDGDVTGRNLGGPGHDERHRFVGREPANEQDPQPAASPRSGRRHWARRLVHDFGLTAPRANDLSPLGRRDQGEGGAPYEPSMESLEAGRHAVTLGSESTRMTVEHDGGPDGPGPGVGDQPGEDRGIGDHDDSRAMTPHVASGLDRAPEVAERDPRSARAAGGVQAQHVGTHGCRPARPDDPRSRPRPRRRRGHARWTPGCLRCRRHPTTGQFARSSGPCGPFGSRCP